MNSQLHTGLKFSIQIKGMREDLFKVVNYRLYEGLSEPFRLEANIVCSREDINAADILEQPMLLQVWQDGILESQVHAHVYQFTSAADSFEKSNYQLVAGPSLLRLQWRQNSRIFQTQTSRTIIETILKEHGIVDVEFIIKKPGAIREYCVQYCESDYTFISRLAAEEGVQFFFVHESDKHTLRFVDDKIMHPKIIDPIPYNPNVDGIGELRAGHSSGRELFINYFKFVTQVGTARAFVQDYNFKTPKVDYGVSQIGANISAQRSNYEYFDYPGRYKKSAVGQSFAQYRIDALRRDCEVGSGKSNHPEISSGYLFNLCKHSTASINQQWLVTGVTHIGEQAQSLQEDAGNGVTSYRNEFTVIPAHLQWRPDNLKKPVIDGLQVATVTGPPGEEIFCDKYGRVKVQFPWDRYGKSDDQSSCWIRVANSSSGGKYGHIAIPRIGHEVLVSHLNGDPDQPIIVGRTFNDKNMPPYELPAHKTRSTWKSDSHKSVGSNEIRYEDATGAEEIYMHAQKDQNNVVENNETTLVKVDRTENIGNNEVINIGNDRTETVGNNEDITIGVNRTEKVGTDEDITIGNNRTEKVGNNESINIGNNQDIKIGNNQDIKIGSKQSIKIGSSQSIDVGSSKTEKIAAAYAQTVGAAKALTIMGAYQVSVGAIKNETVGISSTEQVGMLKHIVAGKRFELVVGSSSLILNADGTIILKGKEIKIEGSKHIEILSELVDVN